MKVHDVRRVEIVREAWPMVWQTEHLRRVQNGTCERCPSKTAEDHRLGKLANVWQRIP